MKPAPFQLHRARSLDHAIELLATLGAGSPDGPEVKLLAGGQSLMPLLNFRLARPDHVIDLTSVEGLSSIMVDDGTVRVGALVPQRALIESPVVAAELPLATAAARWIGSGPIRSRGTVGGSLAHADPAAELPAVVLALDGVIRAVGPGGERLIEAEQLFAGWLTTELDDDEIVTEIELPSLRPGRGRTAEWGFQELARRPGDFATVLVATVVTRAADGTVVEARIVAGGVGPTPIRCRRAEAALVGTTGADGFAEAAAVGPGECDPSTDVHADRRYRTEMVGLLIARALRAATPVPGSGSDSPAASPDSVRSGAVRSVGPAGSGRAVVNGDERSLADVADRRLLADWLRDDLRLTGTHLGCEHGVCGACTVLLDGEPVRSCLVLARQIEGRRVTTIEGLGPADDLRPVQAAFRDHHGLQCGFCTPGMVLAAVHLLAANPNPSEAEIREGLSGNICRCTGYVKIVEAVRAAADPLGPGRPR